MTLLRLVSLAALGSSVCALQIPLLPDTLSQNTLGGLGHNDHKPLVDTEALQAAIKIENLVARAEDLFKIAQLGEPEYNHPTRVIGSEGKTLSHTPWLSRGPSELMTHSYRTLGYALIHLRRSG